MATSWTLTAEQICRDGLELLNVIGTGETVRAEDQQLALRALDGVLKELPLYGYLWPKLSGEVALTWGGAGVQTLTLPTDFYNYPQLWKLVSGQRQPLKQIAHGDWVQMPGRATAGDVTHFYINPSKVLYLYPTPATVDPGLTIQYQKIVDDASTTVTPDVLQILKNPLGYGVANELSMKYGLGKTERDDIERKWNLKRTLALESAISYEPIVMDVDDGPVTYSPLSY